MSEHMITIEGGTTKRLPVSGKFCDRDILIAAIGGGGLPDGISALASGIIAPTSNITTDYTVTHDLGKKPDFAVLMLCDDASTTALQSTQIVQLQGHKPFISGGVVYYMRGVIVYQNSSGTATNTMLSATDSSYATATTIKFRVSSAYPLKAGYTYRWVAGMFS